MKAKSILAALLLLVAGLQTAWAQKVLLYKTNSQMVEYEVSELDSIVFVEAEAKLVQQIVLSVTSLSLQPNDMRFLTATVLPENAQNKVVTWQSSDTNVAEVNQSGRVIANANGTCVITCRATDGSGVKATCQVTVGSSGQEDDQGYVEIGGLKWATMNVGATTVAGSYETCYGDYFAWGETQPRYATITHYPTITVKGVEASFTWKSGYSSGYSESNYPSYTGSTLDAAHDAATANWGSTWRTPTKADYEALAAACSGSSANSQKPVVLNSTITKGGIYWLSSTQTIESAYTGVAGLLFVSASDISKRVFFPASGYIFDTSLNYSGANPYDKDGFYWSSTLYTSDTSSAYALDFSSPGITPSRGYYRCYGFTVRPVCNGSGAAALVTIITISPSTLSLEVGKTQTLTATVLPSNANNKAVAWTSSNTSVATVSTSGMVTAKASGTCTITCAATDGSGVYAECQVAVGSSSSSDGQTYTVNGVSFKMIPVAGGTFQMGSSDDDSGAYDNEKPRHQVTLSSFSIGETEVTQELWQAVMGSNPSYFKGNKLPVEKVSWNDCQTFITKLNELTGKTFRLPTEAEWEYAARGGNQSKGYTYSGSNTIGDVAWYYSNSSSTTHAVATKAPNELGIYDMSGNVLEWCQDWYSSYSSGSQTNPTGPSSGYLRVYRGGSWSYTAAYCRVANRSVSTPTGAFSNSFGLRLAL